MESTQQVRVLPPNWSPCLHQDGTRPSCSADFAVAARYVPSAEGTFACLDGSSVIPFSAVNDDYCDCADGSDEPGTSACEGRSAAYFFCWNRGHIPGKVLASRVNDGICDPECCDGSDEWASGACPDRCAEISKVHREKVDAEQKTRRTVSCHCDAAATGALS